MWKWVSLKMLLCDALLVLPGKHIGMFDRKFIMLSIHDKYCKAYICLKMNSTHIYIWIYKYNQQMLSWNIRIIQLPTEKNSKTVQPKAGHTEPKWRLSSVHQVLKVQYSRKSHHYCMMCPPITFFFFKTIFLTYIWPSLLILCSLLPLRVLQIFIILM